MKKLTLLVVMGCVLVGCQPTLPTTKSDAEVNTKKGFSAPTSTIAKKKEPEEPIKTPLPKPTSTLCSTNPECSKINPGFVCNTNNIYANDLGCVAAKIKCTTDAECPGKDNGCENGACVMSCSDDDECGQDQSCVGPDSPNAVNPFGCKPESKEPDALDPQKTAPVEKPATKPVVTKPEPVADNTTTNGGDQTSQETEVTFSAGSNGSIAINAPPDSVTYSAGTDGRIVINLGPGAESLWPLPVK